MLIGFLFLEKQLANILDRGFLFLRNTRLLYSLSPHSQTDGRTEKRIHSLRVGWRNLPTLRVGWRNCFSSCAVVSVFGSGGKLTLFYSIPLLALTDGQTDRQTEKQIHSLRVGWRNLFPSCAVVSVFCSGEKLVLVLLTTYVLRVPYSCGVVLVFLVLAGNSFWCYVRT